MNETDQKILFKSFLKSLSDTDLGLGWDKFVCPYIYKNNLSYKNGFHWWVEAKNERFGIK